MNWQHVSPGSRSTVGKPVTCILGLHSFKSFQIPNLQWVNRRHASSGSHSFKKFSKIPNLKWLNRRHASLGSHSFKSFPKFLSHSGWTSSCALDSQLQWVSQWHASWAHIHSRSFQIPNLQWVNLRLHPRLTFLDYQVSPLTHIPHFIFNI